MPFPINTFGIVEGGGQSDKKNDDASVESDNENEVTVLPFSIRVMRCVLGQGCPDCVKRNGMKEEDRMAEEKAIKKLLHMQSMAYCSSIDDESLDDDKTPAPSTSALAMARKCAGVPPSYFLSPAVYNPVLATSKELQEVQMPILEQIILEYRASCDFYHRPMNAGVLTTLRFSVPYLRVTPDFVDADMLALSEVLIRHANGPLRFITRLDFSKRKLRGQVGFGSHGALILAKILQSAPAVVEVFLERNRIGSYGATAIFLAARRVEVLRMRRCRIGERGALAFAAHVHDHLPRLRSVDLSANYVGYSGCLAVEQSLMALNRQERPKITVDLEGNVRCGRMAECADETHSGVVVVL